MTAPLILLPVINQEKRPKTPETNLNPKECNTNMAGEAGELHLQAVLNYINDWVGHIPDTMPGLQLPGPMHELVETIDGNNQDATL